MTVSISQQVLVASDWLMKRLLHAGTAEAMSSSWISRVTGGFDTTELDELECY